MSEGNKFDGGKLPWHLLPPDALEEITRVLQFGANKYGDRNWEQGMAWHRPFSALMRHMWAWWRGEDTDPETGITHLAHAGCCILFLLAYEKRGVGTDDRPTEPIMNRVFKAFAETKPRQHNAHVVAYQLQRMKAKRGAAEMPLSFGAEAPPDWLGKNIVFRVGKGGDATFLDKSTGEWKSVDDETHERKGETP